MKKFFTILEKITKNQERNGAFIILFSVLFIIFLFCSIFNLFFLIPTSFSLTLALFVIAFSKIHQLNEVIDISQLYIKKLEEENQDYKKYTEIILNSRK